MRNEYYYHIRKAKRLAWERFLEGVFPTGEGAELIADSEKCWKALRYTKSRVPSYMPAIKVSGADGRPDTTAATAEEKEKIFIEQAFPSQIRVEERDCFHELSGGREREGDSRSTIRSVYKKSP